VEIDMGFLKPRTVDKAKIEARVAAVPVDMLHRDDDTIAPLNPGFFTLERMRQAAAQPRKKLRG
jgi:hypothetical protein